MNMKDGGPAFPFTGRVVGRGTDTLTVETFTEGGMSLRDWFAGQALVGIAGVAMNNYQDASRWAREAYDLADAMLKAREES